MRNCLKSLLIIAGFVAASFVGVKGSAAATGQVSVPLPSIGTMNVNLAGGSNLAVNAPLDLANLLVPATQPGAPGAQDLWDADLLKVGTPASIYTVFCYQATISSVTLHQQINSPAWKCASMNEIDNAPANVNDLPSLSVLGTLDTSSPTLCQWFQDPVTCGNMTPGTSGGAPPVEANMFPNFDPYVGQSLGFEVVTNWCTFLAPPNYDIVGNLGNAMSGIGAIAMGCADKDPNFTINSTMRKLASADTKSRSMAFDVKVQASPYDCHVPKVKGLTLHKAKARLHSRNCGATVRYVKGTRAGRVRYQPLPVGTGRPRGYRVTLAVVR